MSSLYYVIADKTGRIYRGGHAFDGTLPPKYEGTLVICDKAVARDASGYTVVDGVLVPPPVEFVQAAERRVLVDRALKAGLTINSPTQPLIDGTYSLSQNARNNINSIENFILKHGKFPGTAGILSYPDQGTQLHLFYEVQTFSDFATAVTNYVTDLDLYGAGVPGVALPESSVVIA